jgi:patatin-like phospholipase/acyl hydrolase
MGILTHYLDGGGTGGLSQIFILYEIAHRIMVDVGLEELPRLCDYFDMIGGIGMGG